MARGRVTPRVTPRARKTGAGDAASRPAGTRSHRRATLAKRREERRALAQTRAAVAVGPIKRGLEVFVLTGGQFSLTDVLLHVLETTGRARVDLATWTAGAADIGFVSALVRESRIERLRFLVDFSFPSRQPAYCAALRKAFGDDAIRVTKNHAKFIVVRNRRWNVVVRTSQNMNENRRLETLEVSDDAGLAAFLESFVDEVFARQADDLEKRPGQHVSEFATFAELGDSVPAADASELMGDGAFANDVRRGGLSFLP